MKIIISSLLVFILTFQSSLGFIPTNNYELDLSVIENKCLDFGNTDILDSGNSQVLCEIVTNSPSCQGVEAGKKRICDPNLVVETNAGVEFISCLKGLWGSAVEFAKFMGSIIDYVIDSETRQEKNEELVSTMQSAKHFLAMEWSRSLSETDGFGPLHYMNAAKHFSSTMGRIIFNMLEETYFSMQENYACLNGAARTEALCQFAGTALIPPAIVMAKVAKFLINRGKTIKRLANRKSNDIDNDLDTNILSSKELKDNESEFNDIDEDVSTTKYPYAEEANLLNRIEVSVARQIRKNPEKTTYLLNQSTMITETTISKMGIPTRKEIVKLDGEDVLQIRIHKDDLLKSSTPISKELLNILERGKLQSIVLNPNMMRKKGQSLNREPLLDDTTLNMSTKGFQETLLHIGASKRAIRPSTPALRTAQNNPTDASINELAKELNNEGFAVRVITLKRTIKDKETKKKKEITTKALQFNQYASNRNHPGVQKLQRFRNDDFRQKILFYPDKFNSSRGESNRGTRAVSFNFSNLDELLQGHHENTVPHEFRHAKFEYNRSKGIESDYDLRVKHAKPDGKLHDGRAYTNYFSMEEIYNHSQDIYHAARSVNRNADPESALKAILGKTTVISNITKGFRAQNDSLNMSFSFDIDRAPLKFQQPGKGFTVQIGKESALSLIKDNNGYGSIVKKWRCLPHYPDGI